MSAASGSHHSLISERDAVSLLAHEMSNTLMVIQSHLDQLRYRHKDDPHFREIDAACSKSSTVLRGAISLVGATRETRQLLALGEYMETTIEKLVHSAHHGLGLRTHEDARAFVSPEVLNLTLVQIVSHLHAIDDTPELYVEVYTTDYDGARFAVITLSGPARMQEDPNLWAMLKALMHLQGGELLIDKEADPKISISVMLPIFQKRDSTYSLRKQNEISSAMIVEDNIDVAESISLSLNAMGIPSVEIFAKPQEALAWLDNHTPALVITDYSMVGMNGIEFLQEAQNALASSTIALISGMPANTFADALESLQVPVQVLMKPLKGDDLLHLVMQALYGGSVLGAESNLKSMEQTMRIQPQKP